jgi:hypothetical protein
MNAISLTGKGFNGIQQLLWHGLGLLITSVCPYNLNTSFDARTAWAWIKGSFHDNRYVRYVIPSRNVFDGKRCKMAPFQPTDDNPE